MKTGMKLNQMKKPFDRRLNRLTIIILELLCTDIKTVTKRYGEENSWTFGNCSSCQVYGNADTYTEECCQLSGDYQLVCKDSYGDGWHGGYIQIGESETKYCENFEDGHEEATEVTMTGKFCSIYIYYLMFDVKTVVYHNYTFS